MALYSDLPLSCFFSLNITVILYYCAEDFQINISAFHLECGCYVSEVCNASSNDQHFPCRIRKRVTKCS